MQDEKKQAEVGLNLLKDAIFRLLSKSPDGLGNTAIARTLNLRSDREGKQQDYLTWSILSLLMKDGLIIYYNRKYHIPKPIDA